VKIDTFRILGWLIPALCIGTAGALIWKKNGEFIEAGKVRNQMHLAAQQALEKKREIDSWPVEHNYAAVPEGRTEESTFLDYLKSRCASCSVALSSWTSQTDDYGKGKAQVSGDQKIEALLKGLRRISSTVTVTGSYNGLRALVMQLEASDRLYTLSNPTWSRTPTGTTLSVIVSRFVVPKVAPRPAQTGSSPGISVSQ